MSDCQLVITFNSEEARETFLDWFANCDGDDSFLDALIGIGQRGVINYSRTFKTIKAWGWDGSEPPVIGITVEPEYGDE